MFGIVKNMVVAKCRMVYTISMSDPAHQEGTQFLMDRRSPFEI